MANFNAGAIESTLTLDRSDFSKELKAAQEQARRFEKSKISVGLDLEGTDDLDRLAAKLKRLDDKGVDIKTKVSGAEAIERLKATLASISNEEVSINVDADSTGEITKLRAKLKAIPDEKVEVKVDSDKGVKNIISSTRALNGMRFAIAIVAGLLPTLAPLFAGAAAAAIGFAGALSIVGVGLGAFALVAVPALKNLKDALKEVKGDISKLPPELQALAQAQKNFKEAQKDLAANTGVSATLAAGYRLLTTILNQMGPIITVVASVLETMINQLDRWAKSPAFASVVAFITAEFVPTFTLLAVTMANIIRTFGSLVAAFQPFTTDMLGGLARITAGWAKWAASLQSSEKFQQFLVFVRETGPKVLKLFVAVGAALINLGKAVAPLGGPVLDVLTGFFTMIANMNASGLGAVLVAVASAIVLFQAWTAAVALLNLVMAANPIALVVIAILALAAGIAFLWKNNETFRKGVLVVWGAIKKAIGATASWIANTAVPWIIKAFGHVVKTLQMLYGTWRVIFNAILKIAAVIVVAVYTVVRTYITGILTIITGIGKAILAYWKLVWVTVSGVIGTYLRAAQTVVRTVFTTISTIVSTALAVVRTTVATVLGAIKLLFSGRWGEIPGLIRDAWGKIKGHVDGGVKGIKTAITDGLSRIVELFRGLGGRILGAAGNLGSTLYNAGRDVISGLINGIKSLIPNVNSVLGGITSKLPSWKGPEAVDKKILEPSGKMVLSGFINGILKKVPELRSMMGDLTGDLSNMTLTGRAPAVATAAAGAGITKREFMEVMSALIEEIRRNTQPLIGEYNDAHRPAREIAEEWWFITKGRGI